jgi:hypothetical protein
MSSRPFSIKRILFALSVAIPLIAIGCLLAILAQG